MHIGIDLGTTYCCVAYIDDEGNASIIPSSDNSETTPSVIWFDSKQAFVGKKANDRKIMPSSPIYEFVKRDIGKARISRYEVNGFYYGPVGMSAIILRKLKKEAFTFFKKKGMIDATTEEKNYPLRCVITVPAYFGDKQRQDTMLAGYAAGLEVMAVINEPTAAALAYGKSLNEDKKIMVFDLGGGTFDVTILEMKDGKGQVIASDGADQLGGKDWDELIQNYLYSEFIRKTGKSIPDELGWEIQQKALQAKFELTEQEHTSVVISDEGEDIEISLHRSDSRPKDEYSMMSMDDDVEFYFEERASSLLSICRSICTRMIEKVGLQWGDIHDIILAGGSCRMPMIPKMLEELTGRKIARNVPGFSYDTAIAFGAAIYGRHGSSVVRDVTSRTIGIELSLNGRGYIEPLIEKNKKLPLKYKRAFKADANAVLKVYEGDSPRPDECLLRGRLELHNPEGDVEVVLDMDEDGVLLASVEFPPAQKKELRIITEEREIDKIELKNKVHTIDVRL